MEEVDEQEEWGWYLLICLFEIVWSVKATNEYYWSLEDWMLITCICLWSWCLHGCDLSYSHCSSIDDQSAFTHSIRQYGHIATTVALLFNGSWEKGAVWNDSHFSYSSLVALISTTAIHFNARMNSSNSFPFRLGHHLKCYTNKHSKIRSIQLPYEIKKWGKHDAKRRHWKTNRNSPEFIQGEASRLTSHSIELP